MAKGKNSSGKVRFDGLDVAAMVAQLQRTLLGRRVINIYDGVSDHDSFLLKLDGTPKTVLFLESGIRLHITQQASLQQEGMPSPFCSKLRKHLRGLRLETVSQLGNYDRVVLLVFGTGAQRHALILELYARGNLILTNASYEILALLRSHEYEKEETIHVKVGHVYPVTHATSMGTDDEAKGDSKGLLDQTGSEALDWAKAQLVARNDATSSKKKDASVIPLKALLLKPTSGVHHYGPSLIEHCILCANLDPNTKLSADTLEEKLAAVDWEKLVASLQEEGSKIMTDLSAKDGKGYILHQPKPGEQIEKPIGTGLEHTDKILQEFQPHLLKQHQDRPVLTYDTFSDAVDDFFAHIGGQKRALRAEAAEATAKERLSKIRQDQERRVEALVKEQEKLKEHAKLVQVHAEDVDKALTVINSALDSGMDWEALEELVETEQKNENPIALLIKRLDLANDAMVLSLSDPYFAEKPRTVNVTISLHESAYSNASSMFAKYRASKDKSQKTIEASTKALKAAEATAQRQLAEAQRKSKTTATMHQKRKPHWFEKFHWMITSDNYLVIGGRDAQQNELLVKRYLRQGDAYIHADVHGAASCILRAKRRRSKGGKTEPVPLPEQALREAGNFTICHSSAWASRMVTSAWWVESHQVSKTAPTGEYLTVGSFMVRGKKSFLPPSQLEMGLAVLFRLGDDDSISRHRNERRDFSMIDIEDYSPDEIIEHNGVPAIGSDPSSSTVVDNGMGSSNEVSQEVSRSEGENDLPDSMEGAEEEAEDLDSSDDSFQKDATPDTGCGDEVMPEAVAEEDGVEDSTSEDILATEPLAMPTDSNAADQSRVKKGFSKKDRKLIKKYGSLEAAEKAISERTEVERLSPKKASKSAANTDENSKQSNMKRGKRGKAKRAAKKYGDQDEEDRELALLALHGGEKTSKKTNGMQIASLSATEQKTAAETTELLVKDSKKVAAKLPESVQEVLAECVTVKVNDDEDIVRWDKFDADVLEQVEFLKSEEQQLAAAKRLLCLKQSTRVDNFSASLSGIIRTINKYGHENLDGAPDGTSGGKRKTKSEKAAEQEEWKETLAKEGIIDESLDDDAIDDTIEISKLTGKPHSEDSILYAVPVCAPYQTLAQYKYRVKLTPGNQKRGKAAKQCVEMFMKSDSAKSREVERYKELIKQIGDNDFVQTICSDVKISAPGASKLKGKKAGGKKSGKKKK